MSVPFSFWTENQYYSLDCLQSQLVTSSLQLLKTSYKWQKRCLTADTSGKIFCSFHQELLTVLFWSILGTYWDGQAFSIRTAVARIYARFSKAKTMWKAGKFHEPCATLHIPQKQRLQICSVVTFLHTALLSHNISYDREKAKSETPTYKNKSKPNVLIYRQEVKSSTHSFHIKQKALKS